jgi:hypothetical protein
MSQNNVVSIAGVDYDSHSGLPVEKKAAVVQKELIRAQAVAAKGVHKSHQRSVALNRKFVKKSVAAKPAGSHSSSIHVRSMDMRRPVKRSPHISKFAREPQAVQAKRAQADVAHVAHPVAAKAHVASAHKSHHAVTKQVAQPSARDIKHAAMGKALAHAKSVDHDTKQPKKRAFNVAAATLGVLLIAGYFTYVNMPNLSVRVAAAQAGIDASYPEYRPVGYHLNGPVSFQDGQVSMNFASNSSSVAFALNQSASNWDSSALLEKYVDPRSKGNYATYNDGGLTIYTYGTDAAWVNGGILYTVEGDASLSNEQIRRIATSM